MVPTQLIKVKTGDIGTTLLGNPRVEPHLYKYVKVSGLQIFNRLLSDRCRAETHHDCLTEGFYDLTQWSVTSRLPWGKETTFELGSQDGYLTERIRVRSPDHSVPGTCFPPHTLNRPRLQGRDDRRRSVSLSPDGLGP